MKVTCHNCGKRFDYDTYTGLCPKCSTYYRLDTPAEDVTDIYTSGTDFELDEDSYTEETEDYFESIPATEEKEEAAIHTAARTAQNDSRIYRFKTNHTLTIVLLTAIVLVFAVPFFSMNYLIRSKEKQYSLSEIISPTPANIGETISFHTDNSQYDLTITNLSNVTDTCYQIPDGYQLVAFHYTMEETVTPDSTADTNRPYTPLGYHSFTPSLHTQSGQYLQAISEYDIANANGSKDYEWREETGTGSNFEFLNGCVYFLVKENDIASLLIQHTNSETNEIIDSYQIDNLEVDE